MPDIYAQITAADPTTLERLAAALELRAADLLQRGILQAFVGEITFPEKANVLEIGCGTGAVTRFIAGLPQVAPALGVDPSPVFISKARELAEQRRNLAFREVDGRALDNEDRSFDTVLFHTALCHIPNPERRWRRRCGCSAPEVRSRFSMATTPACRWRRETSIRCNAAPTRSLTVWFMIAGSCEHYRPCCRA